MVKITNKASPSTGVMGNPIGLGIFFRWRAVSSYAIKSVKLWLAILMVYSLNAHAQAAFMSADEVERFGGSQLFNDQGYRVDNYRSPTPSRINGTTTVDTQDLVALIASEPDLLIVDVINQTFQNGRFLIDKPHQAIKGAYWLPNTGQGDLEPRWEHYLLSEVQRLSAGRMNKPIVVACKSDCWLSWNVALRLYNAGYRSLYWYRNGVDTWMASGKPVATVEPVKPVFSESPGEESSNNNL